MLIWHIRRALRWRPPFPVVQSGFPRGYGSNLCLQTVSDLITSFLFGQSRRKWAFYILAPIVMFVGLSLFINYMSARDGSVRPSGMRRGPRRIALVRLSRSSLISNGLTSTILSKVGRSIGGSIRIGSSALR